MEVNFQLTHFKLIQPKIIQQSSEQVIGTVHEFINEAQPFFTNYKVGLGLAQFVKIITSRQFQK